MRGVPGSGGHLHTGVESRIALEVVHDDAVVAVDDVLVDAFPAEVLQDLVDAVNAVQNGLQGNAERCERGSICGAPHTRDICLIIQ